MKKTKIIQTIKNSYPRDTRKQVVKTLLEQEKQSDIPDYKIINQIFSYVLAELGWDIAKNNAQWYTTPLDIMEETFPQIKSTQWYKEQILTAKKPIEIRYEKDAI